MEKQFLFSFNLEERYFFPRGLSEMVLVLETQQSVAGSRLFDGMADPEG